jgi:hypothetical protein
MDDPAQKPQITDDGKSDKPAAGSIEAKLHQILSRHEQQLIDAGLPVTTDGKPLPNHLLRSALFGVTAKVFRREQEIASVDGIRVYIARGYRPTQAHLDVWEHCLALAGKQGTGKQIRFSAYSFLKAIGRTPNGGSERKWLHEALLDLAGCIIRVSDGRYSYFGPLLEEGFKDEKTEQYVIKVNPRLAVLFAGSNWTALDSKQRAALRRHPLAQWLHAFYSTHAKPHTYKVETIQRLCGSETEELWRFRQLLKRALDKLSQATGWRCFIDEDDGVVVQKKAKTMPDPLEG